METHKNEKYNPIDHFERSDLDHFISLGDADIVPGRASNDPDRIPTRAVGENRGEIPGELSKVSSTGHLNFLPK